MKGQLDIGKYSLQNILWKETSAVNTPACMYDVLKNHPAR